MKYLTVSRILLVYGKLIPMVLRSTAQLFLRHSRHCTRLTSTDMTQVTLAYHGPVAVIKMQNGENRFTPTFFKEFLSALDQVER